MHATVRQMSVGCRHIVTLPILPRRTTLELKQMVFKGVALVTGAARGIGKAVSLRLAHDGFKVAINDISTKTKMLDSVVEEMKAKGQVSSAHVADVTVEDEVRGMIKGVVDTHGRLDVMVANAGVASYTPLLQLGLDEWERIMKINAQGVFLCYKHAGMQMIKQGKGEYRMIGASSVAGKQGYTFNPAYCASKFAVRGLTQSAAVEFGPHGITVNAYAPGAINTEMLSATMTDDTPHEVLIDEFKKRSPLGVVGVPTDVADLVSFLASKESKFITGQSISVNGGVYFD